MPRCPPAAKAVSATRKLTSPWWHPEQNCTTCKHRTDTFKVELICIADAIDHGTLFYRTLTRHFMLPSSRLFHWAKRAFEWHYLRQYR